MIQETVQQEVKKTPDEVEKEPRCQKKKKNSRIKRRPREKTKKMKRFVG